MAEMGLIGVGEENVLIRAGECSLTLLPHLGGKIASISVHGIELLQAPLAPLAPRTQTMSFDASDASGWDECLPSVGACTVTTADGPAQIPDHGDLWRVEWETQETADRGHGSGIREANDGAESTSVTLCGECFSLPLSLVRKVALSEKDSGWRLDLSYKL